MLIWVKRTSSTHFFWICTRT